jgi:uncharacterized membrane protein YbhN (UPF0104 family)
MAAVWKIARIVVPVIASVAALAAVGYAIDWAEVAGIALATPLWAVAVCVAIILAELVVAGLRLSLLANALGAPIGRPAAMSVWSVAHLAGLVLPTSVGNEVVKGGFLLKVSPNPVRVIGVLAIERMVATFALGLLVLASAPVAAWRLGHPLAPLVTVACGGAVALMLMAWVFRKTFFALARRGARMVRVPEKTVDDMAATLARVPFGTAVALSLAIHCATVALIAVLLDAAGADNAMAIALLGGPVVILVSLLPVSVGGFGVREGAFVLVFGLFGTQAAVAASVGLAWWGVQVIAAIIACALAGAWFVSKRATAVQAG